MMAEYTSNQYKYLIVKRLQRHLSMKNSYDRAYTQTFFWKLFDDSITVTEEAYNNFCRVIDDDIALSAEKGWYSCLDLSEDIVKDQSPALIEAFAKIGITLGVDTKSDKDNYLLIFTKPNGETMTYKVGTNAELNFFYINAMAGTEYNYAIASAPAYNMQGMDVPEGLENPKIAGPRTYWSYNAETQTMTISGDGAYAGVTNEAQLGSGVYTTVICGAGVSRLLKRSIQVDGTVLVLLRPSNADMEFDPSFNAIPGSCGDTKVKIIVYTDCAAAIAALSTEEQAEYVTLHSLSEWEG